MRACVLMRTHTVQYTYHTRSTHWRASSRGTRASTTCRRRSLPPPSAGRSRAPGRTGPGRAAQGARRSARCSRDRTRGPGRGPPTSPSPSPSPGRPRHSHIRRRRDGSRRGRRWMRRKVAPPSGRPECVCACRTVTGCPSLQRDDDTGC